MAEQVTLHLRMKEPLRAKIEVAAKERGVSLNEEIVARLERTFAENLVFPSLAGSFQHAPEEMWIKRFLNGYQNG